MIVLKPMEHRIYYASIEDLFVKKILRRAVRIKKNSKGIRFIMRKLKQSENNLDFL
jgi:hypothetical protein